MTERSSITQVIQVAPEVTPGTPLAATKVLAAMSIAPSPDFTFKTFAPTGYKYDSLVAAQMEWVKAPITGYPTYTELVYPLASVLVSTTPVLTAATVETWTFTPSTTAPDTVQTYTVEHGSSVQAEKFAYGIVSDFGIDFSPKDASITGSMFGQRLSTGITLTGSLSQIKLQPILPTHLQFSIDTSSANLGNTVFTRVLSAKWAIANRFAPLFVLNSANSSFVTSVETNPTSKIEVELEADAAGMALFADARASNQKFVRLKATGPTIPGSTGSLPYVFQLDASVEIDGISGMGDKDGVYKITVSMDCIHDSTWGKAFTVVVKNDIATL